MASEFGARASRSWRTALTFLAVAIGICVLVALVGMALPTHRETADGQVPTYEGFALAATALASAAISVIVAIVWGIVGMFIPAGREGLRAVLGLAIVLLLAIAGMVWIQTKEHNGLTWGAMSSRVIPFVAVQFIAILITLLVPRYRARRRAASDVREAQSQVSTDTEQNS